MLNINVSDLHGITLDWAVAMSAGLPVKHDPMGFKVGSESGFWIWEEAGFKLGITSLIGREYSPSTSWVQGGPIIDTLREYSQCQFLIENDGESVRVLSSPKESVFYSGYGAGVLIAAMRCFVAIKLGEVVDVPEALIMLGPN